MKVLMVGVDDTSLGGMLTVINNYRKNQLFCDKTNLMYIPATIHANKAKKVVFSLTAIRKIKHLLSTEKYDIVHVHMSDGLSAFREGYIMKIAKRYGCHTVCHIHAADYETWFNRLNKYVKKSVVNLLRYSDVIIALGNIWKTVFEKITPETKIEVLYNAVYVPSKNQYNQDARNVIFLGHMIKRKGIDDLLDAIQKIRDVIPSDVRFKLYGADREGTITERIMSRKLDDRVDYCGWLKDDEKEGVFREAMLNVLPSYNEGLPMAILETMAYGIPNISTSIAAIPEAITSGQNGIMIKPGDVNALSAELRKLIEDRENRITLSKNAYDSVSDKFSIEGHINSLLKIYEQLVRR